MIRPLLDGDDPERYRTDGYVALGPILDDDQCAALFEVEHRYRPDAAGSEAPEPGLSVREQPNRSRTPRVGMLARYGHPSVRMMTHRDKPSLADRHSWMVLGEAEPADARVSR